MKNKSEINAVTATAADVNKMKSSSGRGFQCNRTHIFELNADDRVFAKIYSIAVKIVQCLLHML